MTQLNTKRFQYDILLVSPFNWGPLLFKWPVYHSTQSSRSHLTPTILFSRESIKAESEVTQSKEAHWAKLFNRFGTFLNTLPKKIDSIFAKPSCIILPAVTHSFKRATDSVHNFWSSNKCSREQKIPNYNESAPVWLLEILDRGLKYQQDFPGNIFAWASTKLAKVDTKRRLSVALLLLFIALVSDNHHTAVVLNLNLNQPVPLI